MADQPKQPAPKVQNFNMKESETQTLQILQQSHQRSFAATLSLIAQDRMGYKVTEHTQFKLNAEMTEMEISEIPLDVPTAAAPEAPQQPPAEPKSGAVPAQ